jgi:hypothetical protein
VTLLRNTRSFSRADSLNKKAAASKRAFDRKRSPRTAALLVGPSLDQEAPLSWAPADPSYFKLRANVMADELSLYFSGLLFSLKKLADLFAAVFCIIASKLPNVCALQQAPETSEYIEMTSASALSEHGSPLTTRL